MEWLKQAWRGFVETYTDCPALVIAVGLFTLAMFTVAFLIESWPLGAAGLVLVVVMGVVGFTHPEAQSDAGEYGDGGL